MTIEIVGHRGAADRHRRAVEAGAFGGRLRRRLGLELEADDIARALHFVGGRRGQRDADAGQILSVDRGGLLEGDAGERAGTDDLRRRLDTSRRKLFERRAQRIKPGLDDKLLTSWNALMIAAFARAGQVLDNSDYIARAATAKKCARLL